MIINKIDLYGYNIYISRYNLISLYCQDSNYLLISDMSYFQA